MLKTPWSIDTLRIKSKCRHCSCCLLSMVRATLSWCPSVLRLLRNINVVIPQSGLATTTLAPALTQYTAQVSVLQDTIIDALQRFFICFFCILGVALRLKYKIYLLLCCVVWPVLVHCIRIPCTLLMTGCGLSSGCCSISSQ